MKNLRTTVLCVCISLSGLTAFAQINDVPPVRETDYNKPKQFAAFPQEISISSDIINAMFNTSVGAGVEFSFGSSNPLRFAGEVISTVSKYENSVRSVIIRSSNFTGARLIITKIVNENGGISYTGRILSKEHGDVYELKQLNDSYVWVKKNYHEAINE
jgi:hypothetical protein